MSTSTIPESQIQSEIDQLKTQFPQTRDLYREACVLLFFRYGITPTANKLYQYVRKGSMSAPAEALNKFWLELRDKSRIRLEHPDIPHELRETAGNFIGELWSRAQATAQGNFTAQIAEAEEKIAQAQQESAAEREHRGKMEADLELTRSELKIALQNLAESEKIHAADILTLANLEKSLKTLRNERDQLGLALETARQGFSSDLDKLNVVLAKAEERYRALEVKSLLEMDRERQRVIKLEKELKQMGDALREQQRQHLKELAGMQKVNSGLREKLGVLNGQLAQVKEQQKQTVLKLSATEKRLITCSSKLMRLQDQQRAREKSGE